MATFLSKISLIKADSLGETYLKPFNQRSILPSKDKYRIRHLRNHRKQRNAWFIDILLLISRTYRKTQRIHEYGWFTRKYRIIMHFCISFDFSNGGYGSYPQEGNIEKFLRSILSFGKAKLVKYNRSFSKLKSAMKLTTPCIISVK